MRNALFAVFVVLWLALLTFAILRQKPPTIVATPAPTPVQTDPGLAVGRYQVVKVGPETWRFDTTSGDLCLMLTTEEKIKAGVDLTLCLDTPEQLERNRRFNVKTEFNKLPKEQRTLERYQQMLRGEK